LAWTNFISCRFKFRWAT